MLLELFGKIQQTKRPESINATKTGNYSESNTELIYNDSNEKYEELSKTDLTYTATSASALTDFIKEECRRRKNDTGDKSTLQLNLTGGMFIADTDFKRGICNYNRKFSQQWETLQQYANETLSHKEFMRALKKLKPSIDSFDKVFESFAKIRLIGSSKLVSNPIFISNQSEEGYSCKYSLDNGQEEDATLPDKLTLNMPYGKGTDKKCEVKIELLFSRNEFDGLEIEFGCPELDNVEEQAIKDEAKLIRSELTELTDLLVLADF